MDFPSKKIIVLALVGVVLTGETSHIMCEEKCKKTYAPHAHEHQNGFAHEYISSVVGSVSASAISFYE